MRERLAPEIGSRFATAVADGPDVVVVRRLDIRLKMRPGGAQGERVAALCARGLAQGVSRILAGEGDSQMVSRYRSWADYQASFLADLARGAAAGRWQYGSLASYLNLPFAAAVREMMWARPSDAIPTLAALEAAGRSEDVVALLNETDGWAVLYALEPAPRSASLPVGSLVAAIRSRAAQRAQSAGALAIAMTASVASAAGTAAISSRTLEAIRRLARVEMARRGSDQGPTDIDHRRVGVPRSARRTNDWRELQASEPELLSALDASAAEATAPPEIRGVRDLTTAYGGIFLLLPGLAELDLEALLGAAGCRPARAAALAPLGRALILVKCLPPEVRQSAWRDPALWLAAYIDRAPARATLRALGRTTPRLAPRLRTAVNLWAERRRLKGRLGELTEVAAIGSRSITIMRDQENGLWLDVRVGTPVELATNAIVPLPPAAGELAFFYQRGLLGTVAADLAWSQLAAITLNLLARRIPWFQHASAAHLARNILIGASTYTVGLDGVAADLPRAPLQLATRMAGWQSHNRIPWLPGGELSLISR
jgi:hypothetical protein